MLTDAWRATNHPVVTSLCNDRNDEIRMMNDESKKIFDLEERTARFAEQIIDFVKTLPRNSITFPLITQLVRSGTSVGANYCEADDAESRKDFRHKIGIARKESRETMYWLRIIVRAVPESVDNASPLAQEAKELNLIFSKIVRSTADSITAGKK